MLKHRISEIYEQFEFLMRNLGLISVFDRTKVQTFHKTKKSEPRFLQDLQNCQNKNPANPLILQKSRFRRSIRHGLQNRANKGIRN